MERSTKRAVGLPAAIGRITGLALSVWMGSSCSLILDPERHDDVDRCDFDDDCPIAPDPRDEQYCTVAATYQDQDIDFSRICATRPAVSCDPREYPFASVIASRYREATRQVDRYAEHCTGQSGIQGCVPNEASCTEGLAPHPISRRCDDADPQTPPAVAAEPQVAGQDVLDQFCRAVYCNVDFACRARDFKCVPCQLGDSIGSGGCGDLYIAGQRSGAYQSSDELIRDCAGPQVDLPSVQIGPVEGDDDIIDD